MRGTALSYEEPGSRREAAPRRLRLVQAFVNSVDIEGGADEIETPNALRDWLVARDLIRPGSRVDADAHRSALVIREGLRQLALANNAEQPDRAEVAAMNEVISRLPVTPRLSMTGDWHLESSGSGVDAFLADIVAITVAAMADGSWSRMKACQADTCQWVFYDHSRNRSSHWCSMAVCGSREKARAYRKRRRAEARA